MVSIYFDLKEVAQWEDHPLPSRKIKKRQFLQALLIKDNYLYVTGQHVRQMTQAAKIRLLLAIGTKKEVIALLLLWTFSHLTKILFWLFMIFIFVCGKQTFKLPYSQVWFQKALITRADVGVQQDLEFYLSASLTEPLISGTLWTSLTNGQCNIQSDQLAFHQWNFMTTTLTFCQ